MRNHPKTFLEALKVNLVDTKKAKKFLQDKRLTLSEKKILNCWFLLKNCKHAEIFADMETLVNIDNPLVECQRKLILGIAYNNTGDHLRAVKLIDLAFQELEKHQLPEHHFIALYNLFVANYNMGEPKEMARALDSIESLISSDPTPRQQVCFNLCQFNYNVFIKNYEKANLLMPKIEKQFEHMSDALIMNYLIGKFLFFVKSDRLTMAEGLLEEIKKYRLFRFSPTFTYMRLALGHLLHGDALYVYKEDFKDCDYLYFQLKVIQGLEEADQAKAEKFWAELMKIDPKMFGSNFQYNGEKNLFTISLEKYRPVLKTESVTSTTDLSDNKSDALIQLLQNSKIPVRKDVLFRALWGRDAQDTSDDNRLKNLIYYVRKSKNITIAFKKGCYFIDEIKKGDVA